MSELKSKTGDRYVGLLSEGNSTMNLGGIGHGTLLFGNMRIEIPKGIPKVKKVEFHNETATVVYWDDGDVTRVKVGDKDTFNPEYGYAMCIAKKVMGSYDRFAWSLSKAKHYNNGKKVKRVLKFGNTDTVIEGLKILSKISKGVK